MRNEWTYYIEDMEPWIISPADRRRLAEINDEDLYLFDLAERLSRLSVNIDRLNRTVKRLNEQKEEMYGVP